MAPSNEDERTICFRVAQLFFEGKKVSEIADLLNEELSPIPPLTREKIYPILAKAEKFEFVRLLPPRNDLLANAIGDNFNITAGAYNVTGIAAPGFFEFTVTTTSASTSGFSGDTIVVDLLADNSNSVSVESFSNGTTGALAFVGPTDFIVKIVNQDDGVTLTSIMDGNP